MPALTQPVRAPAYLRRFQIHDAVLAGLHFDPDVHVFLRSIVEPRAVGQRAERRHFAVLAIRQAHARRAGPNSSFPRQRELDVNLGGSGCSRAKPPRADALHRFLIQPRVVRDEKRDELARRRQTKKGANDRQQPPP